MWTEHARQSARRMVPTTCAGCGAAIERAQHSLWRANYCAVCIRQRNRAVDNKRKREKYKAEKAGAKIPLAARQAAGRVVNDPGPWPLVAGKMLSEPEVRAMLSLGTFNAGTVIAYNGSQYTVRGEAGARQTLECVK